MNRNHLVFCSLIAFGGTALAGKLDLPADYKYPNIVPPIQTLGGFGTELAGKLTQIQDIEFDDQGRLIVVAGAPAAVLALDLDGSIKASASSPAFVRLGGLAIDGERIYVIDAGARQVRILSGDLAPRGSFAIADMVDPADIAVTGGKAYVTDNTANRIHVFDVDSGAALAVLNPIADGQGLRLPQGIKAVGGALVVADAGNNRLVRIRTDGEVINHWGSWGSYGGQLATPVNIDVRDGLVFVADQINHRLQAFSLDGEFQYQWGRHPPTAHEGQGRVHYPSAIAVDQLTGQVAVCEVIENRCQIFANAVSTGDKIAKVSDSAWWEKATRFHYGARPTMEALVLSVSEPDTHSVLVFQLREQKDGGVFPTFITRIGGQGSAFGQMIQPSGLLIDAKKQTIWVSDRGNLRLQQFAFSDQPNPKLKASQADEAATGITKMSTGSGSNKFVRAIEFRADEVRSMGTQAKATDRRSAMKAAMNVGEPSAMARHPNGDVYMIDPALGRVHIFSSDMVYKRSWGHYGKADNELLKPLDIAISKDGKRVYVVDEYAFKVKVFTPEGGFILAWGGPGANPEQFVAAFGVATTSTGDVFVSDTATNTIKKFTADGQYLLGFGGWGVGPGEFYKPKGLAVDEKDRLVVMDFGNHRGQIFDANGKFLSMFGISQNPNDINTKR